MQLRYYQKESVISIFEYFANGGKGNPVIALPTGTGKGVIIAELVRQSLEYWPNQRFIMLTHVKELIAQNAEKLRYLWPNAPLGIFSAGLNEKNSTLPIIFAGIASVNASVNIFGHFDIVIVDECHTISTKESSMYQKVINELKIVNPNIKVIGLSATPFRVGQGMITDGGLFTDIVCDYTSLNKFNQLMNDGFISPLIPKRTSIEYDTSQVKLSNGDFAQHELQEAIDVDAITYAVIKEMVEYGYDRNCGLVFTAGIEHCEHVTSCIQSFGETATCVHSKMPTIQRDERIRDFKAGFYKYIVSNGVLTTGFDHPPIDIIGMLRPTMSPGLWVQILGRGTRPYDWMIEKQYIPGFNYTKQNCLVLDFAGNTKRLGPINDPVKPRKKGQKAGEAPIRICGACGVYNHASARFCCACGQVFEFKNKLFVHAGTDELIKTDLPLIETFNIDRVIYHKYNKIGSPNMIRVSYYCGLRKYEEFVCLEHGGYAGKRAREWWKERSQQECPANTEEALNLISHLAKPARIKVQTNCKYPKVLGYEY
jgi:DNA repair protein RadD